MLKPRGTPTFHMFRRKKRIYGTVQKPTGACDVTLDFDFDYRIAWSTAGSLHYFVLTVPSERSEYSGIEG